MSKITLYIVPHTHYDAEVFLTREATLKWGAEHILDALYLLETDPGYRFTLDQRCYVEGFAHLHPEQVTRLRAHVAAGRVELAGGMHGMPDVNLPSGESLVRQVLYGQAYFEREFGARSTTAWMLDIFGHHPQVPQLIDKSGFDSYVFCRGYVGHAGFTWVGLDGSRLRCEWLPYHYCVLGAAPATLPEFTAALDAYVFDAMREYTYTGRLLALAGFDLHAPNPSLPDLVRAYNAAQDRVQAVLATPREYLQAQAGPALPEVRGDFNPLFTGCYAARIRVKQRNRELESKLLAAEALQAVNWADASAPVDALEAAWEPVLFNQSHDSICGSHIDASYQGICDRFDHADRIVGRAASGALDGLIERIDTRGQGIPVVVANTLAFARADVARCTLALSGERWHALALYDADGAPVPLQLDHVLRHPDGSIKRADLVFVADVPSLGYRTYFVREGDGAQPATDVWARGGGLPRFEGLFFGNHHSNDGWLGNSLVDLDLDLRAGTIRSLRWKPLDWDVVAQGTHAFASVCRQEDRGDPWEYYGPLRGDIMSADQRLDPLPGRGERRAIFSDEYGGRGVLTAGAVMAEMRYTSPLGDGDFGLIARVYAGLPRVELTTELINRQPFVRYRNVFPLNLREPRATHEIPFGAIDRPEGEFPAQNWADVSGVNPAGAACGVALLNRGIPGHALIGHTLTSSLLKCAKVVSYGAAGGYDPNARDEAGFEIGVRHRFEQALVPHAGDWRAAHLHLHGQAFNAPLIARLCVAHSGSLPVAASFIRVEPNSVAAHAAFVHDGRLIVRLAEALGQPREGRVELRWPMAAATETDLVGERARPLAVDGTSFVYTIAPFEVKTLAIELKERTP